jgi:hypothetical protein
VSCLAKNPHCKKSTTLKRDIFIGFLDIEDAGRLPPFKSEMPKRLKNSRLKADLDYFCHPINSIKELSF